MNWKDKYDKVWEFREGRASVKLNNKYGHVDTNGNIITPIIFDNVSHFEKGGAMIELNDVLGYVDSKGRVTGGHRALLRGVFR